ncbi:hypothetical protein MKD41_00215 [Lutibacter sp. A64]|uniref:hypothetical protein n=1 Tax=Lutibacter sp. A64 TaxID=2918526 RepID=UPI001F06823A|nr:hypothetical protein [Lutibacter sp. A64]UMB53922.1 hypothetical protein MKD41_00215 [Lutibacter sp. A64]
MKKQFLNLGKALNKTEQRSVNGGISSVHEMCKGDMGDYNYGSGCICVNDNDCVMGSCQKPFDRGATWGLCA